MNRIYKLIWNDTLGRIVVVAEGTKGARASKRGRGSLATTLVAGAILSSTGYAEDVLPTGGHIVAGAGTIGTNGGAMTIYQSSARLIANWQSFSIGDNNSVTFKQPGANAVALNRVVG